MPKVSIVILNWNQYDFTCECLRSLRRLAYPEYEISIIDNASEDGSADRLLDEFPEINLIRNSENLGVAGGRNVGIKEVLENSPESGYILILDNDTVVETNILEELVKVAQTNEKIGIVTCKVVFYDTPNIIGAAGIRFHPIIFHGRAYGAGKMDDGRWNRVREVDVAPGCVQLIKSSIFKEIGLYDVMFSPNGPEDWEFSLRARKHGYTVFYTSATRVSHRWSADYKRSSTFVYNLTKSYIIFMRKYCPWYQLPIAFMFFFANRLLKHVVRFIRNSEYEKINAYFRGIRDGFATKL